MADDDIPRDVSIRMQRLGSWRWLMVYSLLSLVIQWPLVGALTTHISYGHENEITVPMLNLWTVWWNADRSGHWFRGYWDSPIFFPTKSTFIFSESQPTTTIVAPIIGMTGHRGLAYNAYQLLILCLNGYSAHRLFRRLGHIPWLAFCGGAMSQILPFVMWQFGVVQLTTLFGIYWTLHALIDLFDAPCLDLNQQNRDGPDAISDHDQTSWRHVLISFPLSARLGFSYGLTYWLCNYWGLFLTLLVVPCSIFLWNRRLFTNSFWRDVILATCIAAAMIGPFAWMQRKMSREHNWSSARTSGLVRDLSAHWRDHTNVPWRTLIPWLRYPEPTRESLWPLGGGGLKLILFPLGLLASSWSTQRRRWGLFAATLGVLAFGLSQGPTVRIYDHLPLVGGICPYEWLQKFVPGFALIRSPFRFAIFVQLATVWMAVEALDLLNPSRWFSLSTETTTRSCFCVIGWIDRLFTIDSGKLRIISQFCPLPLILIPLIAVSSVVTLEAVPPKTHLYELPSHGGLPAWVTWLRDKAEPNTAIACLPFPFGLNVNDFEETTIWMYWSTFHGHPLVNGYSGFFPDFYLKTREALGQFQSLDESDPESVDRSPFSRYSWDNLGLRHLNECSNRYVVIKRPFATREDILFHPATRFRWAHVLSDDVSQIDIYQLPVDDE